MSILHDSRYEKIHTGSTIEVQRLQSILEENDIPSILRDDNESAKLGGYALASPDQTRLLVDKKHVVRAKRLVEVAQEQAEVDKIPDEELELLARDRPVHEKVIRTNTDLKPDPPRISKGMLLFYAGYLVYAAFRLYPIATGEAEFSTFRVIITGGLSIFCIYQLVMYFTKQRKPA